MFAQDFISYINGWSVSQYTGLEDGVDRANFQASVLALVLCTVLVSVRQYFLEPMVCYVSTVPGGSNAVAYLTDMCWVEGTVPLNFSVKISHKAADWQKLLEHQMNYYQWVPFVLGLQAVLYYLPRLVWQMVLYNRMGVDLEQLARDACDADGADEDTRDKVMEHVARNIELMLFGHRHLETNTGKQRRLQPQMVDKNITSDRARTQNATLGQSRQTWRRHVPGKRRGNLLVTLYLLIKLIYCFVGGFQLWLMFRFLRLDRREGYHMFGHRLLTDIIAGRDWTETQVFPRLGMCRHSLEQLGNINQAVAQCLLPINMLNEKIYIFLFFFLGTVLLLTVLSVPVWLYRVLGRGSQRHLVQHCLRVAAAAADPPASSSSSRPFDNDEEIKNDGGLQDWKVDRFVVEFLRQDGNFILRMLSMNVGDLTTARLVSRLFAIYRHEGYLCHDLRGLKLRQLSPSGGPTITFDSSSSGAACVASDTVLSDSADDDGAGFKKIRLHDKIGYARMDTSGDQHPSAPQHCLHEDEDDQQLPKYPFDEVQDFL